MSPFYYERYNAEDCRIEMFSGSPMFRALCDLDVALRVLYREIFDAWRPLLERVSRLLFR